MNINIFQPEVGKICIETTSEFDVRCKQLKLPADEVEQELRENIGWTLRTVAAVNLVPAHIRKPLREFLLLKIASASLDLDEEISGLLNEMATNK